MGEARPKKRKAREPAKLEEQQLGVLNGALGGPSKGWAGEMEARKKVRKGGKNVGVPPTDAAQQAWETILRKKKLRGDGGVPGLQHGPPADTSQPVSTSFIPASQLLQQAGPSSGQKHNGKLVRHAAPGPAQQPSSSAAGARPNRPAAAAVARHQGPPSKQQQQQQKQ